MGGLHFDCRHHFAGGFHLDARFETGDGITALFGPSGSGKTTVFALIAGLLRPSDGRILLGERTLVDTARGEWLVPELRRIGVVFQDYLLFPHLTVRQNLEFGKRRRPFETSACNAWWTSSNSETCLIVPPTR